MIGTIVNTACILVGSVTGSLLKKGLGEKYRDVLYFAMGLASMALGISTFTQNLPKSEFPVLFILSLAVGGVAGTALDLDGRAKAVIARRGGEGLANGLISACLLFCVGTFSIVGPIMSATTGDNTFLYTNATLDLVTSMVFAAASLFPPPSCSAGRDFSTCWGNWRPNRSSCREPSSMSWPSWAESSSFHQAWPSSASKTAKPSTTFPLCWFRCSGSWPGRPSSDT